MSKGDPFLTFRTELFQDFYDFSENIKKGSVLMRFWTPTPPYPPQGPSKDPKTGPLKTSFWTHQKHFLDNFYQFRSFFDTFFFDKILKKMALFDAQRGPLLDPWSDFFRILWIFSENIEI